MLNIIYKNIYYICFLLNNIISLLHREERKGLKSQSPYTLIK
jgi:hypothetical protein